MENELCFLRGKKDINGYAVYDTPEENQDIFLSKLPV